MMLLVTLSSGFGGLSFRGVGGAFLVLGLEKDCADGEVVD